MATQRERFIESIKTYAPDFEIDVTTGPIERLADYYELLLRWNERLHLVAPCSPREFAVRHILESLLLLKHLSVGANVVDIGSGAGLPIIPCLLMRDDLSATLIESSQRKAVFLREALRPVVPENRRQVIAARFEEIDLPPSDFLTCRALDRFTQLLPKLIERTRPRTTLLLFASEKLSKQIQSFLPGSAVEQVPHSQHRFLIIARKNALRF